MALTFHRNPYSVVIVFVLICAGIVISSRLLPFVDIPNHLAEAVIFKKLFQGNSQFSDQYHVVPWFYPNTFHAYFTSLFPSVESGDRIYFLIYLILLPSSVLLVVRRLNGNLWFALFSMLFVFNYNVSFGFVGFYMAIPVMILLFYRLTFPADSVVVQITVIALILIAIYFMHAQAALFAILLTGIIQVYKNWDRLLNLWPTALAVVPVFMLMVIWWRDRDSAGEESTITYLLNYYSGDFFSGFGNRIALFVMDFYHLIDNPFGYLVGSLFTLTFIIPVVLFRRHMEWRKLITGKATYLLLFIITAGICFLLLPQKLPGQTPLYERFSTFLMLAVIMLLSLVIPDRPALRIWVIGVLSLYVILWGEYFYDFNKTNAGFDREFIGALQQDEILYGLIYENSYRGRPVYIHFPNYHTIWNGGPAASKIIDYRFGIVRRNGSKNIIPYYDEWIGSRYKMINIGAVQYLLRHGEGPFEDPNVAGFEKELEKGNWTILSR